jgi:hypothetical protein
MTERPTKRKTIYFAPTIWPSHEKWLARWRQHSSLAMSRPFWSKSCFRYSQCDVLQDAPFDSGDGFAGIGMGWSMPGNSSGIDSMASDPEGVRMMLADEQVVFQVYVGDIAVVAEETVLKPSLGGGYKLFLRLYRESDGFDAALSAFGEALLADSQLEPLAQRLSVGKIVPDDYTKNSRFDFDGLVELSVDSLDDARAVLESPRLKAAAEPFSGALRVDWRIIVTKENMFWDQENGIDESARQIRDYPPVLHDV